MLRKPAYFCLQNVSGNAPADVLTKGYISTNDFLPQILGTILRRQVSANNKRFLVFSLPTHFLRLMGAVWLSPIAINLFAPQASTTPKQTKSLQSLTHVGFFKAMLAILKQSTFIFAKRQAKINKLCCSPTKILRPP